MVRSFLLWFGLCLFFASIVLVGKGQLSVDKPRRASARQHARVLMIGDSLSVGAFGGVLRDFLVTQFGVNNVAVYASCGSSPENWLRSEPEFVTKCGYREQTPQRNLVLDFVDGHPPRRVVTPKLEDLVRTYTPDVAVIQLGTNWLDRLDGRVANDKLNYASILDEFLAALRSRPGDGRHVVWITPPDSAHFSKRSQRAVEALIKGAARRNRFDTIVSSTMTHYLPGKTGGDGVHYNSEAGTQWALAVTRELISKVKQQRALDSD
jgi:hypothetical protein